MLKLLGIERNLIFVILKVTLKTNLPQKEFAAMKAHFTLKILQICFKLNEKPIYIVV